ncbi:MAG: glycosyltransferase family 39 protein [Phycisphaerales bacterium]|nr:glycosyltransferase family 39 protein [Phycisphaerales bacterium]
MLDSAPSSLPSSRVLVWIDAKRWWLFALAAALHLASFNGLWRPVPDSATYLTAARSFAAGQGLVENEQPYSHGLAGFPTMLGYIERLAGDAAWPKLLGVHAMGLLSLVFCFLTFRRHAGRPIAVLVTFLFAINSVFLRHNAELLADIPFLLGSAMALWGYELTFANHATDSGRRRWLFASVFLIAGVMLMASMRIVVVVSFVALVIDVLWRTRATRAKWAALAMCLAVAAIAVVVRLADPRMKDGFYLLPKEKYLLTFITELGHRFDRVVEFNVAELFFRVTPGALLGNRIGLAPIDLVISLLVIVAGVRLLRRRVVWGALVALSFLQWLLFYPDSRYFLPVLPLLILGWWDLTAALADRLSRPRGAALAGAWVVLLLAPNLVRGIGFAIEQHRSPFLDHYQRARYANMPELAEQIRLKLPADCVVIADEMLAAPLHYWSGRRTVAAIPELVPAMVPASRPIYVLLPWEGRLRQTIDATGWRLGDPVLELPRGPQSFGHQSSGPQSAGQQPWQIVPVLLNPEPAPAIGTR